MCLVTDAGGEIYGMRMAVRTVIAGDQRPQIVDLDRMAGAGAEHADQLASVRVEGVDMAIAEIADQEIAGEAPEALRRDRQPPGRIQHVMRGEALDEIAAEIELVDEAMAGAVHVVLALGIAEGEGDE